MSVKVGDTVEVVNVYDSYKRVLGEVGVVTDIGKDHIWPINVVLNESGETLALAKHEIVVVARPPQRPKRKITLNSIADVFRTEYSNAAAVDSIKKLLVEAGYRVKEG